MEKIKSHLRLVASSEMQQTSSEQVEKVVKASEIEIRGDAFTASGIARYKKEQKIKEDHAN